MHKLAVAAGFLFEATLSVPEGPPIEARILPTRSARGGATVVLFDMADNAGGGINA